MPSFHPEDCPSCESAASVRAKLILIDEAWVDAPGKDPRLKYFADLRVDDIREAARKAPPLEQFVDGYWCEACGRAFISEKILKEGARLT